MTFERRLHTATVLRSGKVLVTGGDAELSGFVYGRFDGSELYDPLTDSWATVPVAMAVTRQEHTATLLDDSLGTVVIVGGTAVGGPATTSIYTPDAAWGTMASAPAIGTPRSQHVAVLLPKTFPWSPSVVLIAGGKDNLQNPLASAERFTSSPQGWSSGGTMPAALRWTTATWMGSVDKVLVFGGTSFADNGSPDRTAAYGTYLYTRSTNSWSLGTAAPPAQARHSHTATDLLLGSVQKVVIVGGNDSYLYQSSLLLFNPSGNRALLTYVWGKMTTEAGSVKGVLMAVGVAKLEEETHG